MKKLLAVFALFCHINCSMFLPQTSEADVFDENGAELNDVNSLAEYVMETFSIFSDVDVVDEDDDSAQEFLLVRTADVFCEVQLVQAPCIFPSPFAGLPAVGLADLLPATITEILSPPPEC